MVAMSRGVEDDESPNAEVPTATLPRGSEITHRPHSGPDGDHHDHHHHILIEPEEDRWAWRRKIRQNTRQLAVYRVAVAVLGLLLIAAWSRQRPAARTRRYSPRPARAGGLVQ